MSPYIGLAASTKLSLCGFFSIMKSFFLEISAHVLFRGSFICSIMFFIGYVECKHKRLEEACGYTKSSIYCSINVAHVNTTTVLGYILTSIYKRLLILFVFFSQQHSGSLKHCTKLLTLCCKKVKSLHFVISFSSRNYLYSLLF